MLARTLDFKVNRQEIIKVLIVFFCLTWTQMRKQNERLIRKKMHIEY